MHVDESEGSNMKTMVDSDWAGDKKTRKSCSCAAITLFKPTRPFFVRGQTIEALSSAEAEFYAAVMGIAESLHLQQLLAWLGEPHRLELFSDSAAARSILSRLGVGKVRHLQVKLLWVQRLVNNGAIIVSKVKGEENVADIGTKPLGPAIFEKCRSQLCIGNGPSDHGGSVEVNVLGGKGRRNIAAAQLGLPAKIVALAVALCECMQGTASAVSTVKAHKTTTENGGGESMSIVFKLMLVLWMLSLVATAWMTWKVSSWYHEKADKRKKKKRAGNKRDVAVQSPVTYKWWPATPRFTPLPEVAHGSWTMSR